MLGLPPSVRIYFATELADMRNGIDGLLLRVDEDRPCRAGGVRSDHRALLRRARGEGAASFRSRKVSAAKTARRPILDRFKRMARRGAPPAFAWQVNVNVAERQMVANSGK